MPTVQQLADRRLLERYAPPGVLLNEAMEILQYRGRTSPYLEPPPGAASLHILKNIRPELQTEVRGLLQRARNDGVIVTGTPVQLRNKETNEVRGVTVDVIPVRDASGRGGCLLMVFKDGTPTAKTAPAQEASNARGDADAHLKDMERELLATKEFLQNTVEELETSNEELQSMNEELQSSNEELQSTNEELETSKEELQSSNEELTTVNDELQNRMFELSESRDDLSNLLAGVETGVVIVGRDHRIRRVSATAEVLLNLVAGDVGRSVSHLAPHVQHLDIEQIVDEVVQKVIARQETVYLNQRWFTMRVVPYMTGDHSIRGAILLFTETKNETATIDQALVTAANAGTMLVAITHPLLILDETLHVIWANPAFYEMFQVSSQETTGNLMQHLGTRQWAHPELVQLVSQTAATGIPFKNFSITYDFAGVGRKTMVVEGSMVPTQPVKGSSRLVLVVIEEVKSPPPKNPEPSSAPGQAGRLDERSR